MARVLSDENGEFGIRLEKVSLPAILRFNVSRIGYDSTAATTSLHIDKGEDYRIDLRIRARAINLPRIEVVAERQTRYLSGNGFSG